jgi:hypothetical protein
VRGVGAGQKNRMEIFFCVGDGKLKVGNSSLTS